jgi:hypothetical protein
MSSRGCFATPAQSHTILARTEDRSKTPHAQNRDVGEQGHSLSSPVPNPYRPHQTAHRTALTFEVVPSHRVRSRLPPSGHRRGSRCSSWGCWRDFCVYVTPARSPCRSPRRALNATPPGASHAQRGVQQRMEQQNVHGDHPAQPVQRRRVVHGTAAAAALPPPL